MLSVSFGEGFYLNTRFGDIEIVSKLLITSEIGVRLEISNG